MLKSLVINRAKWRVGMYNPENFSHGKGDTRLINDQGYMCCLGFAAIKAGVPEEMLDTSTPYGVVLESRQEERGLYEDIKEKLSFLVTEDGNSPLAQDAMHLNDVDLVYSRTDREERLSKLFGENGIEVIFEGEYEDEIKPTNHDSQGTGEPSQLG